jgi:hypothetical protein
VLSYGTWPFYDANTFSKQRIESAPAQCWSRIVLERSAHLQVGVDNEKTKGNAMKLSLKLAVAGASIAMLTSAASAQMMEQRDFYDPLGVLSDRGYVAQPQIFAGPTIEGRQRSPFALCQSRHELAGQLERHQPQLVTR